MTIRNTYSAESWDKVYTAFQQINFTSYDYDVVKQSLIQYLQIYHAENFNDFVESSELIALLELFSYVAELLAYRVDAASHENFITTAQRKESVLRLAKLISYSSSRNIPARGIVKIESIRTSEEVYDSLGINLANTTILWNDSTNSNWKEQFLLVMNKCMTGKFGQPSKSFQIGDVLMQLYTFNNDPRSFRNGVFSFSAASASEQIQMEAVAADIDESGPFERQPLINSQFNLIYASDGRGDGSDYTGFLMMVKQGTLLRTDYTILEPVANRRIELDAININNTDVWVYRVDEAGNIIENWTEIENIHEQNVQFNDVLDTRKKYEIETLENDRIALLFGDGNFSDSPVGDFQLWTRVSINQTISIPKNRIVGQAMAFAYTNKLNNQQSCNLTFSLTAPIQNNAPSETIEHIRQAAPSTYYAQNRMVNGQDYNTYMLKDQTILRLKTINRTFAGQPKHIDWNDASKKYENVKLFGDDMAMFLDVGINETLAPTSGRALIDTYLEPLLQTSGILNTLTHVLTTSQVGEDPDNPGSTGIITYPRRKFIEDNRPIYKDVYGNNVNPYGCNLDVSTTNSIFTSVQQKGKIDGSLNEKSAIQAAIDDHWYGEPTSRMSVNGASAALIPDPLMFPADDGKIWESDTPRTVDGTTFYPSDGSGSGTQTITSTGYSIFGLRFNRFLHSFGNGTITLDPYSFVGLADRTGSTEVITIEMTSDKTTFSIISNLRGRLPDYRLDLNPLWTDQINDTLSPILPCDFTITQGNIVFEAGDSFVIDITYSTSGKKWSGKSRKFGVTGTAGQSNIISSNVYVCQVNLTGWWEVVPESVIVGEEPTSIGITDNLSSTQYDKNTARAITDQIKDQIAEFPALQFSPFTGGTGISVTGLPNAVQQMTFDSDMPQYSWVFLIVKDPSNGWRIFNRNMKIVAQSPSTKFWYNQNTQIIDSETKKPVYDKIRILRSNANSKGVMLNKADIYDAVGFIDDQNGRTDFSCLEVLPTDTINFTQAGDKIPDNILQFEEFSKDSFQYGYLNSDGVTFTWLNCDDYTVSGGYDIQPYDKTWYDWTFITYPKNGGVTYAFVTDQYVGKMPKSDTSSGATDVGVTLVRRRYVPAPRINDDLQDPTNSDLDGCNLITGLDFMWQHFSPSTHLIDPSSSNIHDAFIMTQGYYSNVINYVRGLIQSEPTPPTPLELRTTYGYLLKNKMLSDTVVLHSGKIKLLFGQLAGERFRAKFRVVKSPVATFSNERIKTEIVDVIDTYFAIQNWDFGETFYATELLSLIHQRLPTQISSVVIVPTYSVNSFGSLFTIDSGFDEILQSAATIDDIEMVDELTPAVLRQLR